MAEAMAAIAAAAGAASGLESRAKAKTAAEQASAYQGPPLPGGQVGFVKPPMPVPAGQAHVRASWYERGDAYSCT